MCPNYEVVEFQLQTVNPLEPRFCCLLLRIYSFTALPSLPAVRCPSGGGTPLLPRHPFYLRLSCLHTGSSAYLGVTCIRPRIHMLPASPPPFSVRAPPLQTSLAPVTSAIFLLLPHRCCCCQDRFYCEL